MLDEFVSIANRALFVAAFSLAALAVLEKLVNFFGFTILLLRNYTPSRMLELAALALLFVIALQLREIKKARQGGASAERILANSSG